MNIIINIMNIIKTQMSVCPSGHGTIETLSSDNGVVEQPGKIPVAVTNYLRFNIAHHFYLTSSIAG